MSHNSITALNLVIQVGIHSFSSPGTKPDFAVNVHFALELGDEWSVRIDYSKLKYLDGELANSVAAKKLATTPFPLIDKHLYAILKECCSNNSSVYNMQQELFITSAITDKLEHWIHMMVSRFHTYPREVKVLINRAFALLPANYDLNSDTLDGISSENDNNKSKNKSNNNNSHSNSTSGSSDNKKESVGGGTGASKGGESIGGLFGSIFKPKSAQSTLTAQNLSSNNGIGAQSTGENNNGNNNNNSNNHSISSGGGGSNVNNNSTSTFRKLMGSFSSSSTRNAKTSNGFLGNAQSALDSEDMLINERPPLSISVKRGTQDEGRQNRVHYEVAIHSDLKNADGKLFAPFTVQRRYNDFKQLWKDLQDCNVYNLERIHLCPHSNYNSNVYLLAKFPLPPITLRNSFGRSLSEEDLQSRTRHLDIWIREVCFSFYRMKKDAKEHVRRFFSFKVNVATDRDAIYLDQFAKGTIEGSRAEIAALRIINLRTGSLKSVSGLSDTKSVGRGSNKGSVKAPLDNKSQHGKPDMASLSHGGAPVTALNKSGPKKAMSVSSKGSNNSYNDNASEYAAPSVAGSEIEVFQESNDIKLADLPFYTDHASINQTDVFKKIQFNTVRLIVCNSKLSWTFPYFMNFEQKRADQNSIWKSLEEKIFIPELLEKLKSQERRALSVISSHNQAGKTSGGGGGVSKSMISENLSRALEPLTPIEERDSMLSHSQRSRSGSDDSVEIARYNQSIDTANSFMYIGMDKEERRK